MTATERRAGICVIHPAACNTDSPQSMALGYSNSSAAIRSDPSTSLHLSLLKYRRARAPAASTSPLSFQRVRHTAAALLERRVSLQNPAKVKASGRSRKRASALVIAAHV